MKPPDLVIGYPVDFGTFYRVTWDQVYRPLALTLRDHELARESVDEAMVRAFQKWSKVRGYNNPVGWVYRVALNCARNRFRWRCREVPRGSVEPTWEMKTPNSDLIEALQMLLLRQREVVVLRFLLDWSVGEVGEALGAPDGTVKSRLHRAVAALPAATAAPLDTVERRGRRRLIGARVGLVAAGVAVGASMVGTSIVIGRIGYVPYVAEPTASPATTTTTPVSDGSVLIAGDEFRVEGLVEAFSEVPMYFGQASPSPRFDTSVLGEERPLVFGEVKVADPDVLDGPTIYVGELDNESVFVNAQPSNAGVAKCLWIGPTPQFCSDLGGVRTVASRPGGTRLRGVVRGTRWHQCGRAS